MPASKLIVASTRLPMSLQRGAEGWSAKVSPGGLATALRAVAARRPFTWVGYPGAPVDASEHDTVRGVLAEASNAIPVFLDPGEHDLFYGEFSNRVLWPLFHALPQPNRFSQAAWEHYRTVNERFADTIAGLAERGDTIWIHDYQLTLVPQMLRERGVDCAIGFFLHIPFPSSETYRTLPVREQILRGMLGADLIGFHTYEYVSHFRSSCLRILGVESEPESILMPSHNARLGVLPIGIEPAEINAMARSDEAIEQLATLEETYAGKTVILGVDRLDYTKGLPQKLLAFEEMLRLNPELRDKVVLIQVAAPSRTGVAEYQALQREIDELAGRINGRYGTLESRPLHYINQNVSRRRLTALYRRADIALVTPVRDGMNLVCLEYIAARGPNPGTLILSEFAGAAACLSGARLINPHNPSQIAETLADAIRTGPNAEAFDHMREFVHHNTAVKWAKQFLERLESSYREVRGRVTRLNVDTPEVTALIDGGSRPLVLLDYDGTLTPHVVVPADARPSVEVRELLADLARFGLVYVVSGRPAAVLDEWLSDLPIGLVCEHGLGVKHLGGDWSNIPNIDASALHDIVEPVLRDFTARTPGSKIEIKAASIAWHYRGADPKFGAWRAKELRNVLEGRMAGQPFSVLAGSRVIEVRHVQMSKGHAVQALLERHTGTDLVVCAGNDRTDEEMFDAIMRSDRKRALICRVGGVNTMAPFVVSTPAQLIAELKKMVAVWRAARAAS